MMMDNLYSGQVTTAMSQNQMGEQQQVDSSAFEEWIENTAERKNLSREELLDRMLSSYWILDELSGMTADAGDGQSTSTRRPAPEPAEKALHNSDDAEPLEERADVVSEGSERSELIREFQELRSTVLSMAESDEPRRSDRPQTHPSERARTQSPPRRTNESLQHTLTKLQNRFEDISAALEDVQQTHEKDVATLEADVDEATASIDRLETTVDGLAGQEELESMAVSIESELSRLEKESDELQERLSELEMASSETAARLDTLEATQNDLEARLEGEFDGIERLFKRVLEKTDDLENQISNVSESIQTDLQPINEHIEDHERLTSLKREAQRNDISQAACSGCEAVVDLAMLEIPCCPYCDRPVSGLTTTGGLSLSQATLEVESDENSI